MHAEVTEMIELDIIPYEKLIQGDFDALQTLDKALHEKGIIGFEEYLVIKQNTNNSLMQLEDLVLFLKT